MPCYFPLHAYKAKAKDADKTVLVFSRPLSWRGEPLDLPCGQCIGCRLERSRQWAVRCMHEASLYDRNSFITLTYNDVHLPVGRIGELCPRCTIPHLITGSVCKAEFQDFMKRLRKKFGSGLRYFHCGEYGEACRFCGQVRLKCRCSIFVPGALGRPHYHGLLFNVDFEDKKFFSEKSGYSIYTSGCLSELWGKGHAVTGDVTFDSASYVARYCLKKVTGDRKEEHYGGRLPEYTTMSRGSKKLATGGIGKGWYDKFKSDVYPLDRVVVRGHITRPPRFYDNLLCREDRSTFEWLKINREKNGNHFVDDVLSSGRRIRVSDSSDRRLMVKEVCKRAEISQLKRSLEGNYEC